MRLTYLRLPQLITGALIAVLLGLHLAVMHLNTILNFLGVETTWWSLTDQAKQGVREGFYLALLGIALFHGGNGLRGIILELAPSVKSGRIVNWVLVVLGLILFLGVLLSRQLS